MVDDDGLGCSDGYGCVSLKREARRQEEARASTGGIGSDKKIGQGW